MYTIPVIKYNPGYIVLNNKLQERNPVHRRRGIAMVDAISISCASLYFKSRNFGSLFYVINFTYHSDSGMYYCELHERARLRCVDVFHACTTQRRPGLPTAVILGPAVLI